MFLRLLGSQGLMSSLRAQLCAGLVCKFLLISLCLLRRGVIFSLNNPANPSFDSVKTGGTEFLPVLLLLLILSLCVSWHTEKDLQVSSPHTSLHCDLPVHVCLLL